VYAGRILCVAGEKVYGYGRKPAYYKWTTPLEYHLFAADKNPPKPPPAKRPAPGREGAKRGPRRRLPRLTYDWSRPIPLHVRAMVLAKDTLFVAGPPAVVNEPAAYADVTAPEAQAKLAGQAAALAGKKGALLWAVSAADGKRLGELKLDKPPAWDAMAAARGRLYLATVDGKVLCLSGT
jgi:hypothetical protein